jgi:leucyl aminopeptidase (aminopeptidase T)
VALLPEEALARTVLRQYLRLRPGERVVIESWSHALPTARAFVAESRRLGAEPLLAVEDEEAFFRSLAVRRPRSIPTAPASLAERCAAYVYFGGPESYPRLFGLPSKELEAILARHGPAWWAAARKGRVRAVRMAIAAATPTAAERYGVDLEEWRREVVAASRVPPDRLLRAAVAYTGPLARARRMRVRHPNGTDLSIRLGPAKCAIEVGRLDATDRSAHRIWSQVPTGVVALPLSESSADGTWESNRPAYHRFSDPPVALGARFVLTRGRLREFSFDRGGEAFARAYGRGGRGRESPGGLTFGLNPEIAKAPELEEVAAGTVGLLLGDASSIGGRNRSRFSYLSTIRGADIDLDGRPWVVGGRLVQSRRGGRARGPVTSTTRPAHPAASRRP